ncbi:hypothetical protein [Actinocorallia aurea]
MVLAAGVGVAVVLGASAIALGARSGSGPGSPPQGVGPGGGLGGGPGMSRQGDQSGAEGSGGPLHHLVLPESFQGLSQTQNWNGDIVQSSLQWLAGPGETLRAAMFVDDDTMPTQFMTIAVLESPQPFADLQAEVDAIMAANNEDTPTVEVVSDPPQEKDPGTFGGLMKCWASMTNFKSSNITQSTGTCLWAADNVAGLISIAGGPAAVDLDGAAEVARRFRTENETTG